MLEEYRVNLQGAPRAVKPLIQHLLAGRPALQGTSEGGSFIARPATGASSHQLSIVTGRLRTLHFADVDGEANMGRPLFAT